MNSRIALFYGIFWMLLASSSNAFGPGDTVRSTKAQNITSVYTEQMKAPYNQWQGQGWTIDTNLYKFEVYTPQFNLGNTGTPLVPIIFDPTPNPLGFFYGNDYISSMLYSDSSIRYYNTRAPYTQLYYVSDPQIHQFFHLVHTQNIGKHFNFALEFQRTRSDGVILNQGTNLNQLTLSINYHIKRYILFANGMYNDYKVNQNGGIKQDTDFPNPNFSDRSTLPVNLSAARTSIFEESMHLKQYFFFGYRSDDSTYSKPGFYVSHSFKASTHSILFNDPGPIDTPFYQHHYQDTSLTHDSLRYSEMTNDISIGSGQGGLPFLRWEAGMTDQWVHFVNRKTDSIFVNYIAHANIYNTGKFLYNLQGKEIIAGNQMGDYQGSAELGVRIDSLRSIRVKGDLSAQTPPLVYDAYYGNNFQWMNHFNKVNISTASLIYHDAKWHLNITLQVTSMKNMVYFASDTLPSQYNQPVQVFSAKAAKDFTLGKWHLNLEETYQYVSSSAPVHIPQFVSENSFFYENYFFHHNLLFRIGVDLYYNTAFYANAYMPVFDQYYLQNQTQLGNYPYIDPFVSFRIKTFRAFFKLENGGSGLIEPNAYYAYALHYPTVDRTLRFGISWDFWN
jgi:hypothetical protein